MRDGSGLVVVVGATGGLGASTFAALLARRLARAGPSAVVDLAGGGGIDVLLGLERTPGSRWSALARVRGTVEPADLVDLLPTWHGVEVLSADRSATRPDPEAVAAVLAGLLARGVTTVVDLAPWTLGGPIGDAVGVTARSAPAAGGGLIVLAGQDVRGVAATLDLRQREPMAAHLVLRARRSRVAPLEAAHVTDLPLLGSVPHDRRIADAVERGLGPVAGRRLAASVRRIARRLGYPDRPTGDRR